MKIKSQLILFLIGLPFFCCSELYAQEESKKQSHNPIYVGLSGELEIPLGELNDYSNTRGGFRIEAGKSIKEDSPMSGGLFLSAIFSSKQKEKYKGIKVETATVHFDIHSFLRWSPVNDKTLNPFFEGSAGFSMLNTTTSSVVDNYPTFLEQVLYGNINPELESTSYMENTSINFAYSVGGGIILKKILLIGVRYQHTNPVEFIDQKEVYVENNSIQYAIKKIPLDMIVVTIGVTFVSAN